MLRRPTYTAPFQDWLDRGASAYRVRSGAGPLTKCVDHDNGHVVLELPTATPSHDRFEQGLSATKQLIESNAKAIAANSTSIDSERKAIRELRRSIRDSRMENIDRHRDTLDRNNALAEAVEEMQDDLKEIRLRFDSQ